MIGDYLLRRAARDARRRGNRARNAARWDEAAREYRRYLGFAPDDFAIRVQLGHVLSEVGDFAAADRAYENAARITPDDADLLLCWGHSRKRAGDPAGARALYARSFEVDGNAPAREEAERFAAPAPEPAPAAPSGDQPPGRVERVEGLTVFGHVHAPLHGTVELRRDGRPFGEAGLGEADDDGRRGFHLTLKLNDDTQLTAHRLPDGAELEGSPFWIGPPQTDAPPAWAARVEVAKAFAMPPGGEVALFVTHSHSGALKPHVLPYLRALRTEGIAVLLVAVTDRQLNIRPEVLDVVAGAIIRENRGYDFGAWAHAIHLHPEVYGASLLYLLNDSVIGPPAGDRFERMIAKVRASDADLVGLTESHEYRWHLQTFFLALKPGLLSLFQLQRFFGELRALGDKDAVIRDYELRFAERMEEAGARVEVLFPSPAALNPALHAWGGLLADGFPFIKLLLLRGVFLDTDAAGWREAAVDAGFDLPLIDATLRAAEEQVPHDVGGCLSAHPVPHRMPTDLPLKVAFYGPWNYDNGLGAAARGTIAALRHAGVRLNLHPIKVPFHVHRPLAPALDIVDFAGPADVAIVHLNPDSWFMLTDDQREAIGRAGKRIGYWVWEMDHLPEAWRHDFSSVDRIWAPSRYCAELFAAQDEAPVDVIPHAVPVALPAKGDSASHAGLGLPAGRRLVLYVFDGSSYLVRKNPAALVRAFAASGLGKRGWTLVLKTKHLLDRPEEGEAFRALAEGTAEVLLLDHAMTPGGVEDLIAIADIYASPHCSEGFGLTIAEAMAAAKPVVATDFGGSTDILDDATGYPVKARSWRLEEDYGHYTAGGTWARVDEPALAAALVRAAADVESGDIQRPEAARARVAERLSYAAVAARMIESFGRFASERRGWSRVERLRPDLSRGMPFESADLGPDIVALALTPDGAAPADPSRDLPTSSDTWIALAPAGSVAAPDFAEYVASYAQRRPDVSIFYADDLAADVEQAINQLRLKPELDLALLAAQDYVGAPLIVRASTFAMLGGLDPARGTAAVADILFRAHAAGLSIARIPHVLLAHPGPRVRAMSDDYRRMLEAQPALAGHEIVPGRAPDSFALNRRFEDAPPVTLLVPTRQTPLPDEAGTYVERLLDGIARTDWPNDRLTVLVGDDLEGEPDWARRDWPFALRRLATPRAEGEPFNYAAKMNLLWRAAETEQIVFLNDDVSPSEAGWLKALQTFAVDDSVGGVGARLLFEDGSIQHAGFMPFGECTAHTWLYRRRAEGTYQDWALVHREWSMLTGAVFATRRALMEQVGGFDEGFDLEFNDTDLCLRLRALGYRLVYTPMAELIHTEKASRGERLPPGDTIARFLSRWKPWLDNDPSWHPHLRRDRFDLTPAPEPDAWYR